MDFSSESDQRLRVLFVSPVSDFKGGAEIVLRNMLSNERIIPVLATPEPGELSKYASTAGIAVCHYHPGAMLRVNRPLRLTAVLSATIDVIRCCGHIREFAAVHRCSIIHSNGLKAHLLCALLSKFTSASTVAHVHDIPHSFIEKSIWRAIALAVDRMILVSRACYPSATLPENVVILRNGINIVNETLPELSHEDATMRVGFVGRFHPVKGLDRLVDWFTAIRAAGVHATLVIRGRPDPNHIAYWERIEARLQEPEIRDFIRFDGWTTGAATYAGLDVILLTSAQPDPAPLVILEAMSAGIIVAAFPTGGIPEMIVHGETGLLILEPRELVTAMRAMQENPATFQQMRVAAHTRVSNTNTIDKFLANLNAIYAGLKRVDSGFKITP